jgi:hypothetical protein
MSFFFPPTSHSHRSCLQKDYHVARPHGILVETSMNATVLASPRRLSTWDVGHCKRRISTNAPCRQAAAGGRLSPLLVIWLRLLPDAVKLRRSIVMPK